MNVVDKDKRPLTAKSTDPSVERLQQRVHLKTEMTKTGYEYGSTSDDDTEGLRKIMKAISVDDAYLFHIVVEQMASCTAKGGNTDDSALNGMLAIVRGAEPKDHLETMLAVQMAAVHNATMTFARRLNNVDNIRQQDSAEKAFNKLARTFVMQLEALKRYRTGGQQKVVVEHVTVNQGGQAIVGNIQGGGGGD